GGVDGGFDYRREGGVEWYASVGGDGEGGGLVAVVRMKVMGCSWKMGVVAWSVRRLAGAAVPEPHRKKREEREYEMEARDI
ncbi:hypothetical protein Tco_1552630, partial [Tanacetum coccineum]